MKALSLESRAFYFMTHPILVPITSAAHAPMTGSYQINFQSLSFMLHDLIPLLSSHAAIIPLTFLTPSC